MHTYSDFTGLGLTEWVWSAFLVSYFSFGQNQNLGIFIAKIVYI